LEARPLARINPLGEGLLKLKNQIMPLISNTLPIGSRYGTPQELLELFAENLNVSASDTSNIVIGNFAPTDVTKLWVDTSGANPVVKVYIGSAWTSISVAGSFSSGITVSGGNIRLNTNSISIDSGGAYAGRVGVNTTTPTTNLDVNGGIKATSLSTSAVSASGSNNTMALAGDLSITASAPATGALSVAGALSVSGTLSATGTAIVNNLQGPTGQGPVFLISSAGAITATSLNIGTAAGNTITCGPITATSLNTVTGAVTCGSISATANTSTFYRIKLSDITQLVTSATTDANGPALPAKPTTFLPVVIGSTTYKIALYNN